MTRLVRLGGLGAGLLVAAVMLASAVACGGSTPSLAQQCIQLALVQPVSGQGQLTLVAGRQAEQACVLVPSGVSAHPQVNFLRTQTGVCPLNLVSVITSTGQLATYACYQFNGPKGARIIGVAPSGSQTLVLPSLS